MASFDFEKFMKSVDPSSQWEFTMLKDGPDNVTVRATKKTSRNKGRWAGFRQLTVKHTPPFGASDGSEAVQAQERQVWRFVGMVVFI